MVHPHQPQDYRLKFVDNYRNDSSLANYDKSEVTITLFYECVSNTFILVEGKDDR